MRKEWPTRNEDIVDKMNVKHELLVNPNSITLPNAFTHHIGKNCVKALDKYSHAFRYLQKIIPSITEGKLKEGICVGPEICRIMQDSHFESILSVNEKSPWKSFKIVVTEFLEKSENIKENVTNLLKTFQQMAIKMSLKIHFQHSHLSFFPESLGCMNDEQGENFHRDLKVYEEDIRNFWMKTS